MNKIKFPEAEKYEEMVAVVAYRAQKDFRRIYLDSASGTRRIKTTKDETWVKKHGTDKVDMATLDYSELPLDWQTERKIGAQIAIDAALDAMGKGKTLDRDFIEATSELLHNKWLERNNARATETQLCSYNELPENEKEKDRFFARAAAEACKDLYGNF